MYVMFFNSLLTFYFKISTKTGTGALNIHLLCIGQKINLEQCLNSSCLTNTYHAIPLIKHVFIY